MGEMSTISPELNQTKNAVIPDNTGLHNGARGRCLLISYCHIFKLMLTFAHATSATT